MIMDQEVHDIRVEKWKRLITEANCSGVSKVEWCRQNSINPKTFFYWQRKLRRIEAEKILYPATLPETSGKEQSSAPSDFIDVTHLYKEKDSNAGKSAEPVQVAFTPQLMLMEGQYRVLIGNDVSEQTLVTLLRALRNA